MSTKHAKSRISMSQPKRLGRRKERIAPLNSAELTIECQHLILKIMKVELQKNASNGIVRGVNGFVFQAIFELIPRNWNGQWASCAENEPKTVSRRQMAVNHNRRVTANDRRKLFYSAESVWIRNIVVALFLQSAEVVSHTPNSQVVINHWESRESCDAPTKFCCRLFVDVCERQVRLCFDDLRARWIDFVRSDNYELTQKPITNGGHLFCRWIRFIFSYFFPFVSLPPSSKWALDSIEGYFYLLNLSLSISIGARDHLIYNGINIYFILQLMLNNTVFCSLQC